MRSFLHTVQKNQMLMMTPSSVGRGSVMKSFINHATPLKVDAKVSLNQSGLLTSASFTICPFLQNSVDFSRMFIM